MKVRGFALMCLAVPGKILSTEQVGDSRLARVQFGGITREAHLDLVPEAQVGDYVVVHVGFAISRVDEEEAQRTLELLEQMGALAEELPAEESTPPAAN
jgi:hydrogenase expression/formation protein HypC